MASKRSTSQAGVSSGAAAPARVKTQVARKHRNSAAPEKQEAAIESTPSSSESPRTSPTFDEIATLAYSYWESRGYQGGSPEEDWLRAEQELAGAFVTR